MRLRKKNLRVDTKNVHQKCLRILPGDLTFRKGLENSQFRHPTRQDTCYHVKKNIPIALYRIYTARK